MNSEISQQGLVHVIVNVACCGRSEYEHMTVFSNLSLQSNFSTINITENKSLVTISTLILEKVKSIIQETLLSSRSLHVLVESNRCKAMI